MSLEYAYKIKISDRIVEDNLGQLICKDVVLARDGVYQYTSDDVFEDGKFDIVELHRDWEDVRKLKYTLEGKPVIHNHVDKSIDLDLDNISKYKIGHLQNVRESTFEGYNVLIGDLFIDNKEVIPMIKDGSLRHVSLGYFYDIDTNDPNRIKQVNMVGEHIALVKRGRAGISKILDSNEEGKMVRFLDGFEAAVVFSDEERKGWHQLGKYGWYKFFKGALYDQGSTISQVLARMIFKNELDIGNGRAEYAFVDNEGKVINSYYGGKEVDPMRVSVAEELDGYVIPDEREEEIEPEVKRDDEKMLRELISLRNKWEDRWHLTGGRDKYNLREWSLFAGKMLRYAERIKELIGADVTKDEFTLGGELLLVLNSLIREIRYNKKVMDELSLMLGVVTFDDVESNIDIVGMIDEAETVLKKAKKKIPRYETLESWLEQLNDIQGVYVFEITGFEEPRMYVAKAINEDEVEVMIFEDVDTLNKALSEFFENFEHAFMTINRKEGRHKNMSAAYI